MLGWLALIVVALTGLFVFAQSYSGDMTAATALIIAGGVIALLVAVYLATHRHRPGDSRAMTIVGTLLLTVTGAAGLWWLNENNMLSNVRARIQGGDHRPSADDHTKGSAGPVSVLIRRADDGKFLAQGRINDAGVALLFDTGASAVMIKHSDAEKAGIDVQSLAFTTPVQTANGTIYAAPVRLRSISVGLLRIEDVEALIAKPGSLNENLLGISFLRRLRSYDLKGDFLTLRE